MKNQSGTIKTNPELYRVVMGGSGGYRRLPARSDHFSLQTHRHFIIIYISPSTSSSPLSPSPSPLSPPRSSLPMSKSHHHRYRHHRHHLRWLQTSTNPEPEGYCSTLQRQGHPETCTICLVGGQLRTLEEKLGDRLKLPICKCREEAV